MPNKDLVHYARDTLFPNTMAHEIFVDLFPICYIECMTKLLSEHPINYTEKD
jgi:hypothetical protein